ncbi:MAG: hypothetical protein CL910_14665 [Deltaproteobacteria bacterium]|nr:hypothetical protein [Deltaproteobacteria bacterium]
MSRHYRLDADLGSDRERVACAVCGGREENEIGLDNGFRIVRCASSACGFVFVNPRPSPGQLKRLYEDYYPDGDETPDAWRGEMAGIFDECRDLLLAQALEGRVLDVGCSFGHLLAEMVSLGWNGTGVEPSPVAAGIARQGSGAIILEGLLEEVDLQDEAFDAVVALYVLEHVADPRGFLQEVHRLLVDEGLAIVRVPHAAPLMGMARLLGRPLLQAPMHLNDFSPRSLGRLARDVGFQRFEARIGRVRRSSDLVERLGAQTLGGTARIVERLTSGRLLLPWSGAKTYLLWK